MFHTLFVFSGHVSMDRRYTPKSIEKVRTKADHRVAPVEVSGSSRRQLTREVLSQLVEAE
jgi:hypothetical protein